MIKPLRRYDAEALLIIIYYCYSNGVVLRKNPPISSGE